MFPSPDDGLSTDGEFKITKGTGDKAVPEDNLVFVKLSGGGIKTTRRHCKLSRTPGEPGNERARPFSIIKFEIETMQSRPGDPC